MATYVEPYPHERRIGERRRDYAARVGSLEGLKVSWGGVWGGVLVAIGLLLLLSVLGVAIGVTAVDPGETQAERVGTGIGIWGGLSLLIALFGWYRPASARSSTAPPDFSRGCWYGLSRCCS